VKRQVLVMIASMIVLPMVFCAAHLLIKDPKTESIELYGVNPEGTYKTIIECADPGWVWGSEDCTVTMVPWEEK